MCVTTFTGKYIDPTDLSPYDVSLEDLIQGTSLIVRFNGQIPFSYSVLQHSINCCRLAQAQKKKNTYILACLIHDLCEGIAPTGDIIRPNKSQVAIYSKKRDAILPMKEYEFDIMETIIDGLGIKNLVSAEDCENSIVKNIDRIMCNSESLYLRGFKVAADLLVVRNEPPYSFSKRKPEDVRVEFMEIYSELTK